MSRRECRFGANSNLSKCAAELLRARFQERVELTIGCSPQALDVLMPNLLLYTFIENAIKHHDFERESVIRIDARVAVTPTTLEIRVVDNGPGILDTEKAMNKGVGLSNARQRLAALYGTQYRFELSNLAEGGLDVHVSIPREKDGGSPAGSTQESIAPARAPHSSAPAPLPTASVQ